MRVTKLREKILKDRGLARVGHGTIRKVPITALSHLKTDKMRVVEMRSGKTIEEILTDGSCRKVARKYGIDYSTVSRWRSRLKLGDLNEG